MEYMSLIAIIGTIASIAGALVSIWHSIRSKNAANDAIQVRREFIDHRKTSELSHLQASCKRAQKAMEKYGPGSIPSSLKGISPDNDARDVQDFLLMTNEYRSYFSNKKPSEADSFCNTMNPMLDNFAQSQKSDELREYGKQILINLSTMASVIKRKLDTKRESTH